MDYVIDLVNFHKTVKIEVFGGYLGLELILQCVDLSGCEFFVFERKVFFFAYAFEFKNDW